MKHTAAGNRGRGGRALFWSSLGTIAYAYAAYPLLLWLATSRRERYVPPAPGTTAPHVDLIVAAREEGARSRGCCAPAPSSTIPANSYG